MHRRKKRLHPSGTPISNLNETQSTDVLKHGDGNSGQEGLCSSNQRRHPLLNRVSGARSPSKP